MFCVCSGGDDWEDWGLSVRRPLHYSVDQGLVHEGDFRSGAEEVPEARDNGQAIPSVGEAAEGKVQAGSCKQPENL